VSLMRLKFPSFGCCEWFQPAALASTLHLKKEYLVAQRAEKTPLLDQQLACVSAVEH